MAHALAYLTALPVRPRGPGSAWTWVAFPLVGALIGLVWALVGGFGERFRGPLSVTGLVLLADVALTRGQLLVGFSATVSGLWSTRGGADDAAEPAAPPAGEEPPVEDTGWVAAAIRGGGTEPLGVAAVAAMSLLRFGVLVPAVGTIGVQLRGLVPWATLALMAVPAIGRLALVAWWTLLPRRDDEPDALGAPPPGVAALAVGALVVLALAWPAGWRAPVALVGALALVALAARWWRARVGAAPPAEAACAVALVAETAALLVLAPGG